MGITRSDIFSDQQNELAALAKVLGHPARIAILERLIGMNECVCGDLVSEIGLAQPTISQHLKELKNTGLIKGTIEGTRVCYCIDTKRWNEVSSLLAGFFAGFKPGREECC